jgi:peroxiredoxin
MKKLLSLLLFLSTSSLAQQAIPNFSLVNARTGTPISLSQYNSSAAIVVLFTSNECPFDIYYKSRVKQLIETYSGKVQFLLINSTNEPQESLEKMSIHYTDLNVPYLADKDQTVMKLFGAHKSPEAFLIKPTGDNFTVLYSGAIDDNPQVATDTKQNYLKDAIENLLTGKKIEVATTRPIGCTIQRK